jgi:hypothetical protein
MITRSRWPVSGPRWMCSTSIPTRLLEDIGTYLVTDPALEPLRRLLRFGGDTFAEFLGSLEELPDRARLAMPQLEGAGNHAAGRGGGRFRIAARWPVPGAGRCSWGPCGRWPTTTARW